MSKVMGVQEVSPGYEFVAENPAVPEGYKQTEVGVIPEDWEGALLEKVTTAVASGRSKSNQAYGSYPVYGSTGVIGYSSEPQYEGTAILVARVGANAGKLNKVSGKYGVTDNTIILRFSEAVETGFVWKALELKRLNNLVFGSGQPLITGSQLKALTIAVPPLLEQRAIATALSDVDALLEELDRLIAKKRDIKQAAMQQLLTGETRLPGFEGKWDSRSLLQIADSQKALFDDGDWVEAEHITDQGIRLVQTGNIGEGVFVDKATKKYIYDASFEKLRCKELKQGDILICRLAEPAGRACVFPDIGENRAITSVDVTIFRPRPEVADRQYLVQYFSTSDWFKMVLDHVGGTTHKRISRGALGKLKVPFPPIEEQKAIAEILSDIDTEIQALEHRRSKTAELKQGMMQELLTGRTRLV